MPGRIYFQTLQYAVQIVGDEDELALRLGVTRAELDRWLSGSDRPTLAIFLKAVDIVQDAAIARLSRAEE